MHRAVDVAHILHSRFQEPKRSSLLARRRGVQLESATRVSSRRDGERKARRFVRRCVPDVCEEWHRAVMDHSLFNSSLFMMMGEDRLVGKWMIRVFYWSCGREASVRCYVENNARVFR